MAKYRKLSRTSSQRKALLRNQVTALLENGKIVTTEAKAKEVRKIAESLSGPLIEYQKIQKWDGKLPTVSGSNALVSIDPAE